MSNQSQQADTFRKLHRKGDPVILFNIWDAGSAKVVEAAGATAIATGSAPVAMAGGFADGEKMPLDLALANIERIVAAVGVPVTMDLEGGYGVAPDAVAESVTRGIAAGAIGFNFEDQVVGGDGLHESAAQQDRIRAAKSAMADMDAFLNARTDIFLKAKPETHDTGMLDAAVTRAKAYADAGADGFFAPGLLDEKLIGALCEQVALPVNIIALPGAPDTAQLANLGVARISYGPIPYRRMIAWLEAEAREVFGTGGYSV